MDAILPEHLFLVARELDGDSYLALSHTSQYLRKQLNEKSFLVEINRDLPFLVVDGSFYAYCYTQHFLCSRPIRNQNTFYKVLKRTIRANKMTEQSWVTLKKQLVKFMIAVIEEENTFANDQLYTIRRRLYGTPIATEIRNFQSLYDRTIRIHHAKRSEEHYQIKAGKVPEKVRSPSAYLRVAMRYRQHEIIYFLLENYRVQFVSAIQYLHCYPDAQSLRALFAALPPDPEHLVYYPEVVCNDDNPEVLEVFWRYLQPRLNKVQFFLFLKECLEQTVKNDYVRCFDFLVRNTGGELGFFIKRLLFKHNACRIIKYYGLV